MKRVSRLSKVYVWVETESHCGERNTAKKHLISSPSLNHRNYVFLQHYFILDSPFHLLAEFIAQLKSDVYLY